MKFSKVVVLLVVALLFAVLPVVNVAAASDGAGQEVANQAEGWLNAVVMIGGIILTIAGVILVLLIGNNILQRTSITLPKVDANPAVLAFGQSVPGRALNDLLGRLQSQVDEPTDPFIQRVEAMKWFKKAHELGLISGEQFSQIVSSALADGIKLTNGVPDVKFDLLGFDSSGAMG